MRQYRVIVLIVLSALVYFCTITNGDTITLSNNKNVDLRILSVTGEYIKAVILKKDITSLNIQSSNIRDYSDVISLHTPDVTIECKVREVTTDSIQVLIPRASISSLQMSFQSHDKQSSMVSDEIEDKPGMAIDMVREEKKTEQMAEEQESDLDMSQVYEDFKEIAIIDKIRTSSREMAESEKDYRLRIQKARIKTENLEAGDDSIRVVNKNVLIDKESYGKGGKIYESPKESVGDSPDDKITESGRSDLQKERYVSIHNVRLGKVEGRILQSRDSLPDCQVKLQLLERVGLLSKRYRPVAGAVEFETTTDKNGIYRFMNMPAGLYKIYWKPHSETEWIGRFKMEPDVIVEPGKLTSPRTIETLKRTLN
jgi:hypothetical protein